MPIPRSVYYSGEIGEDTEDPQASQVHSWARERSAWDTENARLESGVQPPWWEVTVAQSSQRRLPGGGGIRAQPWKMHRIWRGERDQIAFASLL